MRKLLIIFALVFAHTGWSGDFEDGVAAAKRGDHATAFLKFRSAAEQGIPGAQHNLGLMYDRGEGIAEDYKEAMRWYLLAVGQGIPEAVYAIGDMYDKGRGVVQDYKEAVRWFKLAARWGNLQAHKQLGYMYWLGQGVAQDYVIAHMWSNIAAASGDKESVKNRDGMASNMSRQQIEQAQRMARECMASNFKKKSD